MTVPSMPGGTRSDVSFTSEAFSPKIARSSFSSGRQLRLALRRDLADQDVARADLGADERDAALVELASSAASPTFGMSAVTSSGPSFVSRATQVSSSMWIVVKRSS